MHTPIRNLLIACVLWVERHGSSRAQPEAPTAIPREYVRKVQLNQRAAGLSADAKQKISLGRGLVRPDVSAVLFDEPLTVIDPHLKWQLRRKLKQIHSELKLTLIYVTHDQVEALTFAEEVVVMTRGRVVQVGSADALFEQPRHTFVGHFIGSPGMNFISANMSGHRLTIAGKSLQTERSLPEGALTLGIRPEYIQLVSAGAEGALPAVVTNLQDIGTFAMLTATIDGIKLKVRLGLDDLQPSIGESVWLKVVNRGEDIPADALPDLFKRFFRAERSRAGSSEHHGLGLAIVAAIARMHGGQTHASSRSGVTEIGFSIAPDRA